MTVGYLFVRSFCRRNGTPLRDDEVVAGSQDTEHALEIHNGTTISLDYQIESNLPNSPPQSNTGAKELDFTSQGNTGTSWKAVTNGLPSKGREVKAARMTCFATAGVNVIIDSSKIEYRDDPNFRWQEDKKQTLSISVMVK